jgi:isoaspartyl peptidase/L-asparaginase-like protein (Ntn-hydrolase superfamily)
LRSLSAPLWLAVHGGAGAGPAPEEAPAAQAEVRAALARALASGHQVLAGGGSAVDAVVAAVRVLEDCIWLNAGPGSVLCATGEVEMDAAVMDGALRRAGAVAGLRSVLNPVLAARAVMERTPHVLLAGEGAERFAQELGLPRAAPETFVTDLRRRQLARWRARSAAGSNDPAPGGGTVGAVARDPRGHLAAATSTGGITGKLPGRVSDSALIGAGNFADEATCAVSATGTGDAFIRAGFAHQVDALMRYGGVALADACERALADVHRLGGSGGCIAIDAAGRVAMPFDSEWMARGVIGSNGRPDLAFAAGVPR